MLDFPCHNVVVKGKTMTDEELDIAIKTHEKRRVRFIKEGLSDDDAYDLADKLFERDKEGFDDRRLCFECKSYDDKTTHCTAYKDGLGKTYRPLRFILQRCDKFVLRGKK